MRIGLLDGGKIIRNETSPSPGRKMALEEGLEYFIKSIRDVAGPGAENLEGIGIGVPSIVDSAKGIIYDMVNIPCWKCVPIKELVEKALGARVEINNDANCFALAEREFGCAKGYDDIVGITLGTGVGAGIIADGKLYEGANVCAGEIGYIPYLDSHYEAYCASYFFEREHKTSAKEAFLHAGRGEEGALQIWKEYGHHLGNLLKVIMYAYDPACIVLGGSISQAYDYFRDSLRDEMSSFLYSKALDKIAIKVSELENPGILGAASLIK